MTSPEKDRVDEPEAHPKGALVFILIYLVIIMCFWVNTYLRLWIRGQAMKQGATVYLYELAWILPSIAIPVGMLAALWSPPSAPASTCRASRAASIRPGSPRPPRSISPAS